MSYPRTVRETRGGTAVINPDSTDVGLLHSACWTCRPFPSFREDERDMIIAVDWWP